MRRGWLTIALLLSLGVNLGLAGALVVRSRALARWVADRPDFDPGARLAERLELRPPVRDEFRRVQRRLWERARSEQAEIQRLRDEIRAELLSPDPDRDRIASLLDEVAGHEERLNRAFVESVLESREVLPPEALERYLSFVERAAPGRRLGPARRGREGDRRPALPGRERRRPAPPP